jgi:hypothetical protein
MQEAAIIENEKVSFTPADFCHMPLRLSSDEAVGSFKSKPIAPGTRSVGSPLRRHPWLDSENRRNEWFYAV